MKCFTLVLLLCVGATAVYKSYDGYKVFRVKVDNNDQYELLTQMTGANARYDVWKYARAQGDHMDIMVQSEDIVEFIAKLKALGVDFNTMISDVGAMTEANKRQRDQMDTSSMTFDFSVYNDWNNMEAYLDQLQTNYSSIVSLFNMGTSYEGRIIRGAKFSTGGSGKSAVWLDSCIDPREWISCATMIYVMYEFVGQYGISPEVTDLLDNMDIYFVPVVNPDGYIWTWTDDRLWRKTRKPNAGSVCIGTDTGRNWDFFWCQEGATTDPCDDEYCGTNAFSESEVGDLVDFVHSIPNLKMFMSYKSYGQWWMTPWAYYSTPPPTYDTQMLPACESAMARIQVVHGTTFVCNTTNVFRGQVSGTAMDYIYNSTGIPYVYMPELRDTGEFGFELPADQIIPSGEENYAGLLDFLNTVRVTP